MTTRMLSITVLATLLSVSAAAAQQPARTTPLSKPAAQTALVAQHRTTTAATSQSTMPSRMAVRAVAHRRPMKSAGKPARRLRLREAEPGLSARASVPLSTARKTALEMHHGTVTSEWIGRQGGRLVYRFGIAAGQLRHRVVVDAMTGAIVRPQARAIKHARAVRK